MLSVCSLICQKTLQKLPSWCSETSSIELKSARSCYVRDCLWQKVKFLCSLQEWICTGVMFRNLGKKMSSYVHTYNASSVTTVGYINERYVCKNHTGKQITAENALIVNKSYNLHRSFLSIMNFPNWSWYSLRFFFQPAYYSMSYYTCVAFYSILLRQCKISSFGLLQNLLSTLFSI